MESKIDHYRNVRVAVAEGVYLARLAMGRQVEPSVVSAARYAAYFVASELYPDVASAENMADQEERVQLTDQLTGLDNAHGLHENLQDAIEFANRHHIPLALIVAYFTNLKTINDTYGHQAGDAALVAAAEILLREAPACMRADVDGQGYVQDLRGPGRLESGNTFAILCPGKDLEAAKRWWGDLDVTLQQAGFVMQAGFAVHDQTHYGDFDAHRKLLERGRAALYEELGELSCEL